MFMEEIPKEETPTDEIQIRRKWPFVLLAVVILIAAAGGAAVYLIRDTAPGENFDYTVQPEPIEDTAPEGYYDYTVETQQYFVEYSDEYPYWDVLTVEYPTLAAAPETEIEQLELINEKLYDVAMDRVNYWHLTPNDEVKALQEEYHIFASDVQCDVMYRSQYLLCVNYREIYAPINPIWYVFITQRAIMVDLLTGESYALGDVLRLDEDFVALWVDRINEEAGEERIASEDAGIFAGWLNGSDEEVEELYSIDPFFCVTEKGNFIVGFSLNPKVAAITVDAPSNTTYYAEFTAQELEPYRTESVFWDRYDKSESTGEVSRCTKHENRWLGSGGSVWGYWKERQ